MEDGDSDGDNHSDGDSDKFGNGIVYSIRPSPALPAKGGRRGVKMRDERLNIKD